MVKNRNHPSNKKGTKVKYKAGLPEGWSIEVKTRVAGTRVGEKYKCYIAPVTGRKFYSKEKVYHYLNSTAQPEESAPTPSETHVVTERKDAVDGLPPGWTLEMKTRRKGEQIRNDPYYTDPQTGYVFRSKKDVMRYLETGVPGKYAFKPRRKHVNNVKQMDVETALPSTAKRQQVSGKLVNGHLFVGQYSNSNETVNDEPVLESPTTGGGESTNLSSLGSLETKVPTKRKGKKAALKKCVLSTQPPNGTSHEKQLVENGIQEQENRIIQLGSSKRKSKIAVDAPRRVSKRLAGIRAGLTSVMERPNGTPQVEAVQPLPEAKLDVNSTSRSWAYLNSEQFSHRESEKKGISIAHALTGKDAPKGDGYHVETKEKTTAEEASRGEEALRQGTFHVGTEEKTLKHGKPNTFSDHASVEKAGVEKQADENLEGSLALPFGETWPDPCLEFAYKTLTGAIPVENNLAAAIPTSDPCIGFATLTGANPVEDKPAAAIPGTLPLSDPCLEFAYKTLTGEMPLEVAAPERIENQQSSPQALKDSADLPDFNIDDFFASLANPLWPNYSENKKAQVSASESAVGCSNNILQHPRGDQKMECKRKEVNP